MTTVLIVDDSRTVRASLSKILRDHFTIVEGVDGEDGWVKLQENPAIKLIITDIMMPNLDGYGFICRVRGASNKPCSQTPIVVITSMEDEITRERAHACGANNFIVKPVESSDLMDTVKFHTQLNLSANPKLMEDLSKYGKNIENAVIEAPDLNKALSIVNNQETGPIEPYAMDLALQVLPLLRYCNSTFKIDIESELDALETKLKAG